MHTNSYATGIFLYPVSLIGSISFLPRNLGVCVCAVSWHCNSFSPYCTIHSLWNLSFPNLYSQTSKQLYSFTWLYTVRFVGSGLKERGACMPFLATIRMRWANLLMTLFIMHARSVFKLTDFVLIPPESMVSCMQYLQIGVVLANPMIVLL